MEINDKPIRVTIEVSKDIDSKMMRLMKDLVIPTRVSLLEFSLVVLYWVTDEMKKGNDIISVNRTKKTAVKLDDKMFKFVTKSKDNGG
jgi:hypothetical protein